MASLLIPQVFSITDGHEHVIDLESDQFVSKRLVKLIGEIDAQTASLVVSQLHYLDDRSDEDITLMINSPGGSVYDGLAIYDAIKYEIHSDVSTVATGHALSMGAFLLAAGTKGKRFATMNAEIMIHQPLGGVQGQATDISLVADHIQRVKTRLATILSEECSKPVDEVLRDMERDYWMTSEEAVQYGLIDSIVGMGKERSV